MGTKRSDEIARHGIPEGGAIAVSPSEQGSPATGTGGVRGQKAVSPAAHQDRDIGGGRAEPTFEPTKALGKGGVNREAGPLENVGPLGRSPAEKGERAGAAGKKDRR